MQHAYDRLAKDVLLGALGPVSFAIAAHRELDGDALFLDLWCNPDPKKLRSLRPLGMFIGLLALDRARSSSFIEHRRPSRLISAFELGRAKGWPSGVYVAAPALRFRLIVTSELPVTRDTLLLRSLGAGKTLRTASRELRERAEGLVEGQTRSLFTILEARGLEVTPEQRARVVTRCSRAAGWRHGTSRVLSSRIYEVF